MKLALSIQWLTLKGLTLILINGLFYRIIINNDNIRIGCESHSFNEWVKFTNKEILSMDGKQALEFWKLNKEAIIAMAKTLDCNN